MKKSYRIFSSLGLMAMLVMGLQACIGLQPKQSDEQQPPRVAPEVMDKYQSALKLMEGGNHDAALKVFAGVSKMDDSLSGPYVNRGLIYLQMNRTHEAINAFENALTRNPKNATAWMQLGIAQRESFELEAARKSYEKALAAQPEHANAHRNLGILCDIYLRDYDCALTHYRAYQRLSGEDDAMNNWLIDLKERM